MMLTPQWNRIARSKCPSLRYARTVAEDDHDARPRAGVCPGRAARFAGIQCPFTRRGDTKPVTRRSVPSAPCVAAVRRITTRANTLRFPRHFGWKGTDGGPDHRRERRALWHGTSGRRQRRRTASALSGCGAVFRDKSGALYGTTSGIGSRRRRRLATVLRSSSPPRPQGRRTLWHDAWWRRAQLPRLRDRVQARSDGVGIHGKRCVRLPRHRRRCVSAGGPHHR